MNYFKIFITISLFFGFIISSTMNPSIRRNEELNDAIARGQLLKVQGLLNQEADPNFKNTQGETSLLISVNNISLKTNPKIVKALLEHGADVNAQNQHGNTALHKAARSSRINSETIRIILQANPNPYIKNKDGKTACDLSTYNNIRTLLTEYKRYYWQNQYPHQSKTLALLKLQTTFHTGVFYIIHNLLEEEKAS